MKRRVLLIDLGAHFGGVENYLVNLAELLRGQAQVHALCVLPELEARLAVHDVQVTRIPIFNGPWKPLRFLLSLFVLPLLLVRHRIDVVQVNGLLESILMIPARIFGCGAVYTRHGPFELDLYNWYKQPHKYLPRKAAQFNLRFSTHVVCVSHAVAESVRALLPPSRYTVISNWVSSRDTAGTPRTDLPAMPKVLCASRLEQYKGVHLLIEAALSLPEVQFIIVGDGSFRATLEEQAGPIANVQLAGFQRNIPEYYRNADFFVMPSMGPEGLPMTSLEAMAQGLPCIFSDLPVHKEITDNGRGAYLFSSGSSAGLLAGLRTLLSDHQARQRYAAEALRIIRERYTDSSVRAEYLRVLAGDSHA